MAEAPSSRPPLADTSDSLDNAQHLVGHLRPDGIAALKVDRSSHSNGNGRIGPSTDFLRAMSSLSASASDTYSGATSEMGDGSAVSDEEDYDSLTIDPDNVVEGSTGGGLEREPTLTANKLGGKEINSATHGGAAAKGAAERPARPSRRKSIQIRLEKTGKKGRYILTADDPDVREILRYGLDREAAASMTPEQKRKQIRRFRDLVFTKQFTTFDRQNVASAESPFHGFFTLFWLCMALLLVRVAAHNWKEYGSILGSNEIMKLMFSKDVIVLGLTDGVMCAATASGLLLQKLILKGYLTWNRSGWIIQNIWQTFYLFAVIGWTLYRDWPWTHTIFIVLHCMVFLMKQHSYTFYNGYLSQVYRRRRILQQKLAQLDDMEPITSPTSASPRTSIAAASGAEMPNMDTVHNRRQSLGPKSSTSLASEKSEVAKVAAAIESGEQLDADQMNTFERIIQSEIESLTEELRGKCTATHNEYPNNLTLSNWADWICLPTLVYELEYPRQEKINWWYVAEKTAATFGVIWVMMVISQAYIYPPVAETVRMKEAGMTLQERWNEFPWIVSDMLFPLLLEQLLSWYVIWECVLNVLAEVTHFADRGFYGDWWNSVSWDQYARDWNRPVHNFLLRHVYHSSISAFHLSKGSATFVTFFLSACVHELIMLCLFRKVRGYLFAMQLLQIPLVTLSRTKMLKGRNVLGNIIFWIGLFVGPSILTSLYLVV